MPPEPLPWERKEFFKERKHERSKTSSSSSSFGGSTPRWRDFSSHYGSSSSREFVEPGWPPPRSNDFRRPPGRGWHMFGEESGHVYAPSRSGGDKMMEDENFRPRGEGRYVRNSNRDSRGSFSQRYWKGHPSWEVNNRGSPNAPGRPLHDAISNDQRSVDDMLVYPPSSHATHSDFVNTWDPQIQSKDQHDNDSNSNDKMGGVNGLGTGHKGDVENSLEWKPLKWSRTASMSSRGSGYSHSSSSKSLGVDSNEGKVELQPKNLTPLQSPSGDVAACATSAAPSEETTSRKKPRLGWGEGLAKYEKKKVDPDVSLNKDGAGGCNGSAEPSNSQSPSLADKSPGVMGFSDFPSPATPATPSSVACSSSPGVEKMSGKSVNVDIDVSNLCRSPSVGSQNNLEVFSFNLEKVDNSSIANLGSALVELLQSDDLNSADSRFVRSTAMNKLLVWKGDISKELVVTESEIDSLENELKSMRGSSGHHYPPTSFSFPAEAIAKPCFELGTASNNVARPSPLQVVSCRDEIMENLSPCDGALVEVHADVKEDDIDSPGTATSKFVEPLSLVKAVQSSLAVEHGECLGNLEVIPSPGLDLGCSDHCSNENTGVFIRQGVNMLEERKDTPTFSGDVNVYAGEDDNLCDTILASNREYASRAIDVFAKLLPKEQRKIEFSEVVTAMSSQQSDAVKEQLATRRRLLRSNERLLTLKFRAFQHLWKEDMRLLSVRKYRAKSQKKYELSLRTTNSRLQKHRSSIRSRFSSAGNLSLVPTLEMLNLSTKLLSDSHVKPVRNDLKMPALILDKKERMVSRFISSNGLVEDPCAVEKERAMINPWTSEEREIFLDKLAIFGKDFQKIASFLDHKSTADCVEFYYKNHKSDCFEKTKKSKQSKASTNYLVASSKKWNRDMNAASLDILGAASVMAADADNSARSRQLCPSRIVLGGFRDSKAARRNDDTLRRSRNERETVAADVLAGLCGSVSSEAMSSCVTTYADPAEAYQERKCPKNDAVIKQPSPSDVTKCVDEETCSDESCGEMDPPDWTDEEKSAFIQAVVSYGKDFDMISRFVKTRSRDQCKVFFSKARKCLGLDLIHPEPANVGTPVSDDANGGGGDTEDACALESGMDIHSDKLGAEVDENMPLLAKDTEHDGSGILKLVDLCKGCISEDNNANVTGFSNQKVSRVVETSVSDACRMEHCPDLTSDADRKFVNGFVYQSESTHTWKNSVPSIDQDGNDKVAEVMSVAEKTSEFDPGAPNLNAVLEVKAMAEVPTCEIGNELNGRRCVLPENGLSSQSILMQEFIVTTNTSQLPVSTDSCSNFSFDAENMQEVSTELDSVEKPLVVSLPKKRTVPSANTPLHASSMHSEKKQNEDRMSSTVDLQDTRYTKDQKPVNRDDYLQQLSGNSLLNHNDCSQILRGYPLQISTNKELNGDISSRPHSEVRAIGNSGKNVASSQFVVQSYLRKCNSSKALGPVQELPLTFQCREQGSDHPSDLSGDGSDVEKPCRNGNVKLFGKILSNPLSAQKSSSYAQDDKGILHHKPSNMLSSSTLRFAGHHHTDGHPVLPKSDHNGYFGLDNVPMRGYSYWEGNGIQSGFTSIPDSARLLAAYPAAFSSNFQATSSKLQHQALQVAVKGNDCTLNGASVFSPSGSNGVVDYQVYRGPDSSNKVPPFTMEIKQRENIFSEMQRLNGQQGRGVVGMNVVGRGGGGPCTTGVSGISDPVAAIKMHYAKTDKYGAQNGTIVREEESWRGSGDIGR